MEMTTVAYGAEILTFELPEPEPEEGEQPGDDEQPEDDDEDNQDEEAQAYLMSATWASLAAIAIFLTN